MGNGREGGSGGGGMRRRALIGVLAGAGHEDARQVRPGRRPALRRLLAAIAALHLLAHAGQRQRRRTRPPAAATRPALRARPPLRAAKPSAQHAAGGPGAPGSGASGALQPHGLARGARRLPAPHVDLSSLQGGALLHAPRAVPRMLRAPQPCPALPGVRTALKHRRAALLRLPAAAVAGADARSTRAPRTSRSPRAPRAARSFPLPPPKQPRCAEAPAPVTPDALRAQVFVAGVDEDEAAFRRELQRNLEGLVWLPRPPSARDPASRSRHASPAALCSGREPARPRHSSPRPTDSAPSATTLQGNVSPRQPTSCRTRSPAPRPPP
jgi:hypothetical protein